MDSKVLHDIGMYIDDSRQNNFTEHSSLLGIDLVLAVSDMLTYLNHGTAANEHSLALLQMTFSLIKWVHMAGK